MSFNDEFIALTCPNCGSKVEITNIVFDELFVETGDSFTFIGSGMGSEEIKCESCNTSFTRRQKINSSTPNVQMTAFNQTGQKVSGTQINIGNINNSRGVVIGGSVTASTIITGDQIVYGETTKDFVGRYTYVNGKRVE